MSLRAINCHLLVCDGCGVTYDGCGDYTPHFNDIGDAREEAGDCSEWRSDGESDWCFNCQIKPHECKPCPDGLACCARCGASLDDEAVEVAR